MSARAKARALCVALVASFAAPSAMAKPPPASPAATQEMLEVAKGAEGLLGKLEYQRARELLEATVQSPKFRTASRSARARLWALLGRARAELGDPVGMDESFVEAVRLDRSVKLPKGTSPKIVTALEAARVNAPPPEEDTAPPLIPVSKTPQAEEEPQKPARRDAGVPEIVPPPKPEIVPDPPEPPKPPKPEVEKPPKPEREREKPPKPEREKPPKPEREREREKPPKPEREKPPKPEREREKPPKPEREAPEPSGGPVIRGRVEGVATPGGKLRLVADLLEIPKTAKVTAMLRRTQAGSFEPAPMIRTGTTATLTVTMDRPRVEAFIEARVGAKLVASAGSEERPIILSATPSPPPLGDAWAEAPPEPPPEAAKPTRSSTATAAAAASAPPLVPPPAKPREDEGLDTVEIALIAGGGAVLLIGLTTVIIVLAGSGGSCGSPDGFGCAQVQVLRGAP